MVNFFAMNCEITSCVFVKRKQHIKQLMWLCRGSFETMQRVFETIIHRLVDSGQSKLL